MEKVKIWCDAGILTCKNTEVKFTENGIMLDHPEEELFIPYGSLKLVRGHKGKSNNCDIKLQEYR